MPARITDASAEAMLAREKALFIQRNPRSRALGEEAARHWLRGVPMHWMVDWDTPFPLFIARAEGVDLTDADGNAYVDFCLGDTGAMFGHSPPALVETLKREAANGFTTMLPSPDAPIVGDLLADRFGMDFWQVTATASDANRAVLRWCRAITGRSKILIFNGCYHGAVDETFVALEEGVQKADPALVGEPRDINQFVTLVEFNDIAAVERALAARDIACVLTEPVLTNTGMVLPDPGFLDALRKAARASGTLLIMDETHTLSSGPGGYCRAYGLEPDGIVLGKPIAGGIPAAAYGFSAEVAARIRSFLETRPGGRSGIGTTLSGAKIQLALMRCMLETFFTGQAFAPLIALAEKLEQGIAALIAKHEAPWHVVRVGARVEFMCVAERPKNGSEAARAIHKPVDMAVHHYLLNRGVIITPFHNMMLICPATRAVHVERLLSGLDQCLAELA